MCLQKNFYPDPEEVSILSSIFILDACKIWDYQLYL